MRQTESARVTTAKEAKFRVQYPNSVPRSLKVIALDAGAARVVDQVSRKPWNRAMFFNSLSFKPQATVSAGLGKDGLQAWLQGVAGQAKDLVAEIDSADSVVVVASAGQDVGGVELLGKVCKMRHKSMIGLILSGPGVTDQALSRTLLGLRPYTTMLVVASEDGYVEDMLTAMRA